MVTKDTQTATTLERLLAVRMSVDFLEKKARNEQQKFMYTSSSQVLMAVREKMNELGLMLIPNVTRAVLHHKDGLDTQESSSMNLTELWMKYTWIRIDDPTDKVEVEWYAQGADQHEKGVGKAMTYGEKFFILKFFNIPTDKDDPDAGHGSNQPFDQRRKPPAGSKKQQPAADDGGKPGGASKAQYGKLYAMGREMDVDQETVKGLIRWYRKGEFLTKKEASDLIESFGKQLNSYIDSANQKGEDIPL